MSGSFEVRYSDPVLQGESLVQAAIDVHIIEGQEWLVHWYHSTNDADLMVWINSEGAVGHFQLNVGGQICDWSSACGIQTGLIIEIELGKAELGNLEAAETVQFDSALDLANLKLSEVVLKNAKTLSAPLRERLLGALQDARPPGAGKAVQAARARFWGRFKRWTKPAA